MSIDEVELLLIDHASDPVSALLERHGRQLDQLSFDVAELMQRGTALARGPWSWEGLAPSELRYRAQELLAWTAWLVRRYDITELPVCWLRHPAIIEELIALRAARFGAYGAKADPGAPLAWHEAFEAWRARITQWDRQGCGGSRSHRPASHAPPVDMPGPERCEELLGAML